MTVKNLLFLISLTISTAAFGQTVTVGSPSAHCGQQVNVPVTIDSVSGMLSLEFHIAYDAARLTSPAVTAGSLTSSFSVSSNVSGGVLRVAMASGSPVSGGGGVANISFTVASTATGNVPVDISNVLVNDVARSGSSGMVAVDCLQPPSAATLTFPANGAAGIGSSVTLQWSAASGAASYRVNFGTTLPPPFYATTIGNAQAVTTEPGRTYYWSVLAVNDAGVRDSGIASFTAAGTACLAPGEPQATVPAQVTSGNAFDLTWSALAGASDYVVEESASPVMAGATSTTTTATRLSLTRSAATDSTLYFRVHARNTSSPCNIDGPSSAIVSVHIVPRPPLATGTRVFPVVGTTEGNFGSLFRTAVQLHNPTNQHISGKLTFHVQAVEGRTADPSINYSLGPGETASFADIVAALGLSRSIGSLDLVPDGSSAAPLSAVRVFNDAGTAGTTGMTLDQLGVADAIKAGQRGIVIAPMRPAGVRMNIGIRTLLDGVTMTVTVRAKDGFMIQSTTRSYPPTFFLQLPLSDFTGGSVLLGDEVVIFDVQVGSALICGAITDNTTQDPSVQIARPLS
ncbi:MAG: Cohesin domain [Thermoanaerobaculia bacterium]|nr:Cohesin domain [Thermoanaerobaculia bacterium]